MEAVLGRPLDESCAEAITQAANAGLAEFSQLDWKGELYDHGSEGRSELAKDVCALANHLGGAIIIGVEEDAQGKPTGATGVVVDEGELLWMRAVVSAWTSPFPFYDLIIAPIEGTDRAFVLILVPPSPGAPHALVKPGQKRLLYPVRDGSQTRYLGEPEIASGYRQRFLGLDDRRRRLVSITEEGLAHMGEQLLLLSLSLVPLVPGRGSVDQRSIREMDDWFGDRTSRIGLFGEHSLSGLRVEPGLDRFVVASRDSADSDAEQRALYAYGELHTDGSGVVVRRILQAQEGGSEEPDRSAFILFDEELTARVVDMLDLLVYFAVERSGASGPVEARLALSTNGDHQIRLTTIGGGERWGRVQRLGRRDIALPLAVDRTLDLTAMHEAVGNLLLSARLLAQAVVQAAGFPELRQIDGEGRIRKRHVDARVLEFAARHGVGTTEEGVG
ncbi:MAG: helix-turn-helix domain-containing protein [Acidimicrobiia bacterium]